MSRPKGSKNKIKTTESKPEVSKEQALESIREESNNIQAESAPIIAN